MTLLSILIGLGLEYFLGSLDRIRNFAWFEQFSTWLEIRFSKYSLWEGPVGVLVTLAIPLSVVYLIAVKLEDIWFVLGFIFAVMVFVYCVGSDFNGLINSYLDALDADDDGSISGIEQEIYGSSATDEATSPDLIRKILLRAHDHIFAVIFWFIVLGVVGALLFSLVYRMKEKYTSIHGAYAEAVRNLYSILIWPTTRLLAAGFALAGSLVDALEGWRDVEGNTIECSEEIIYNSGIGAIQYTERGSEDDDAVKAEYIGNIQETQALLNRTLIIWLTILGIMTISGTLS